MLDCCNVRYTCSGTPCERMTKVAPSGTSDGSSTMVTPRSANAATICGLWMIGPSVTAGAAAAAVSTALRTPKQKPACFATMISAIGISSRLFQISRLRINLNSANDCYSTVVSGIPAIFFLFTVILHGKYQLFFRPQTALSIWFVMACRVSASQRLP